MSFDDARVSTDSLGSTLRPPHFQTYPPRFKKLALTGCTWKPNIPTLCSSFRIEPLRLNPRLNVLGARFISQEKNSPERVAVPVSGPMKTQKKENEEHISHATASFDEFTPATPRSGVSHGANSDSSEDKSGSCSSEDKKEFNVITPPTTRSYDQDTDLTSQTSESSENRKIAVLELEDFLSIEAQRRERATLRRNQRDMCDEDKAGYRMRKHEQLLII